MENRHGLAVEGCVTRASGYGERAAALEVVGHVATAGRVTVGADKGYDTRDFVEALPLVQVTPHVAQNTSRRSSAIDQRTTRHAGYVVSQRTRKRVKEIFGWLKTIGLLAQRATAAGRGRAGYSSSPWRSITWSASATGRGHGMSRRVASEHPRRPALRRAAGCGAVRHALESASVFLSPVFSAAC